MDERKNSRLLNFFIAVGKPIRRILSLTTGKLGDAIYRLLTGSNEGRDNKEYKEGSHDTYSVWGVVFTAFMLSFLPAATISFSGDFGFFGFVLFYIFCTVALSILLGIITAIVESIVDALR